MLTLNKFNYIIYYRVRRAMVNKYDCQARESKYLLMDGFPPLFELLMG